MVFRFFWGSLVVIKTGEVQVIVAAATSNSRSTIFFFFVPFLLTKGLTVCFEAELVLGRILLDQADDNLVRIGRILKQGLECFTAPLSIWLVCVCARKQ
jgi:hypothetical protein